MPLWLLVFGVPYILPRPQDARRAFQFSARIARIPNAIIYCTFLLILLSRTMLVDIFARRYEHVPLRDSFEQRDKRLLVQAFRILADDIRPYYRDGNEYPEGTAYWTKLHDSVARELGLTELSPKMLSYTTKWNGNDHFQVHRQPMVTICEKWMEGPVVDSPDIHIKDRLSLVEIGLRMREQEIAAANDAPIGDGERLVASLTTRRLVVPGDPEAAVKSRRQRTTSAFRASVEELNVRFRQAGYPLNYHNGYLQISSDTLMEQQVETPFWSIVSDNIWVNVDTDMKEALDLRDSDGPDPAFYAARALESTIKIISDRKGWTTGKEKGAHNFIENLASRTNAFIEPWEGESLKAIFTHIRNPAGHGAGSAQMRTLSRPQTDWAIEFCMSWIKNLIRRL